MTAQDGTRETEKGIGLDSSLGDVDAIRQHVKEITESSVFKRSLRSARFLRFVVEKAITGDAETLKERLIGSELFGRSASYHTGEDSIVRVTASHVRQRLLRYYSIYGETSQFHLNLLPGSYVPEILHHTNDEAQSLDIINPNDESASAPYETLAPQQDFSIARQGSVISPPIISLPPNKSFIRKIRSQWLIFCVLLLAALSLILWTRFRSDSTMRPSASILPWSALFGVPRSIMLITSDPDIQEIESLAGNHLISVSDYAKHNYCLSFSTLTPELAVMCRQVLVGNKSAAVDVSIVASISRLAQANSREISVHAARTVRLADLLGNSDFIFLGSPRSNPWVHLFNDQLDFRFFTPEGKDGHDIIVNAHPRWHELPVYVPTALHGATGQTFAIVAFMPGLDNIGQILLVAGADEEGTEAAGEFVVDLPLISAGLQKCGISPSGPVRHFELLLGLNTIAGHSTKTDVIACHTLTDTP